MSLSKLPSGSLAGQVTANQKEFREFAKFVAQFMKSTQQRYHALQGDFAIALHNHEIRIKELEAKTGIVPAKEIQTELEKLIVDSAEDTAKAEETSQEPITDLLLEEPLEVKTEVTEESKIRFHKEF